MNCSSSQTNLLNHVEKYLKEKKKEIFHLRHEAMTEMIYHLPWMLPDRYVFILTNLCNLRCNFCFQKKDPRKDAMKTEDWLAFARQLPNYARVTLTGGEPFVFKGFNQVFEHVASRFYCNIITNGLLFSPERIDYLLRYPKLGVVSVSIDDIGNKARDVKPQDWAKAEEMIRYFVKRRNELKSGLVLEAKTVVLDSNAKDLLAIHRYCVEDLGFDHHSFQFLKGSPTQHADFMFEFEDILKKSHAPVYKEFATIKAQLEEVRQYNLRTGKVCFLHPKVGSLISTTPLNDLDFLNEGEFIKQNYQVCKFPWSSVHINVDGNLFPCMAVAMGNVKGTRLPEIIHGKDFKRFKDLIRKEGTIEGCNRCGWLRPSEKAKLHNTKFVELSPVVV